MLTGVKNGVNVWWFKMFAPSLCQETNKHTKFSAIMTSFKRRKQAIDNLIRYGQMTSVQVYEAVTTFPQFNDNSKADLVSYIIKHHLNEELRTHLGL